MLFDFGNVIIFLLLAVAFVGVSLGVSRLLQPRVDSPAKRIPYECGEDPVGSGRINFNIRFYMVALLFIVFDVEIALMFPVAVVFKDWVAGGLGVFALVEMGIFLAILFMGLIYVWAKGDLDWIKEIRKEVLS